MNFFALTFIVNILTIGCYGNKPVRYKNIPLSATGIQVDKIIPLDTTDNTNDGQIDKLLSVIQDLKYDLIKIKHTQEKDRQRVEELEKTMVSYRDETVMSVTEVVQLRQLVSESYDKYTLLEEVTQDHGVVIESLQYFEKEANREIRRYRDYKERAAKRFHQIEKNVASYEQQGEILTQTFQNLTQELEDIQDKHMQLRNLTITLHQDLNETLNTSSQCCKEVQISVDNMLTNQIKEYSKTNQNGHMSTSQGNNKQTELTNQIEIIEFGSGDLQDEYLSKLEETSNQVGDKKSENREKEQSENIELGSGEVVHEYEGSGELGSGETEELPHFVDFSKFVDKSTFQIEISSRDNKILEMTEKYSNLTQYIEQLETRVTSIQLGGFMQSLQESLINFTQNVITIDQWRISSNQIVNSTINNQDQIIKLTNMILENSDKMADLKWKISNGDLLSDQQFNILRMYIIRLNNSVEDLKEQMKKAKQPVMSATGYQSHYYGQQTGYGAGYRPTSNQFGDHSSGNSNNIETLATKMDDIGLQIIYNQNRIGNLEVKMLNESLYTCRKYSMDAYQDSQLAGHEAIIKSNTNSILLTHELVKQLDDAIGSLGNKVNTNSRKLRGLTLNFDRIRGIIPAMVHMKREVENLMYQLPADCSEYYNRGYKTPGVYVIHPMTAQRSSQVTCHMTQDDGWTVIQQRFDGSLNFKKNWTEYRQGFGSANTEYWLGNDIIHLMTSHRNYSLQIDLVDIYNVPWSARYDQFSVAHPGDNYKLTISGYHGNATDALDYSNGMGFSTPDNDNDASGTKCGFFYESGWWFKHCQTCNLNGRYDIGFMWFNLNSNEYVRLKSSTMKIKPR